MCGLFIYVNNYVESRCVLRNKQTHICAPKTNIHTRTDAWGNAKIYTQGRLAGLAITLHLLMKSLPSIEFGIFLYGQTYPFNSKQSKVSRKLHQ